MSNFQIFFSLVKLLFLSFQQNSSANFYHFEKILDSILARAPVETTKLLLSDNLFWILFSYLHEQAVVDALLSLFTCEFPKQSDTIHFYKSLVEAKVFDKIGEKIYTLGSFFFKFKIKEKFFSLSQSKNF